MNGWRARSWRTACSALAILSLAPGTPAREQGEEASDARKLALEDVYSADPDRRVDFKGSIPTITWLDDEHYLERRDDDERPLERVHARTGRAQPFYDADALAQRLAALSGIDAEAADRLVRDELQLNADKTAALLNHANDLFYVQLDGERVVRLTHDPQPEVGEELSPNGRFVSFVRDHDLYVVEVATQRERALTAGGSSELLFGRLDWVYQEELYGRGNFAGYWWSPDSRFLAYLKLDESPVREFTVVDHLPVELLTEVTNYPKAGSPNPTVELGVVAAVGGETRWVDTSRYEPIEHLIVRVAWKPDASRVLFQVQDREQRWLDLVAADPANGEASRLLRETTPAFVEINGQPTWLADGSFLWLSERSGYRHLYHYEADGTLRRQVTDGEWEITTLYGVDEANGALYFAATRAEPTGVQIYRANIDGGGLVRLSQRAGTHTATFSPDWQLYVDEWSDLHTPAQVRLHRRDGRELRVVDANRVEALDRFDLGAVERLQVPTRDGFAMEAMLIKPPDFDPSRKYPVLQHTYGGPHAPRVRDRWGGALYMWHQMLAQRGYVIWICDNRSASGKGIKPTWEAYQRLGEGELRDIEDGVAWLRRQPWVDAERIGIWGWSYGGFMTSYAMTHSTSFRMGIAGAPVTDWRLYDTIYTERYMRMPQNNPDGYDATSVVESAADLSGRLLILHGTMDDNVHLQNTLKLIYELQKAGKEFELMLYPRSRHGFSDDDLVYHMRGVMTRFIEENL